MLEVKDPPSLISLNTKRRKKKTTMEASGLSTQLATALASESDVLKFNNNKQNSLIIRNVIIINNHRDTNREKVS